LPEHPGCLSLPDQLTQYHQLVGQGDGLWNTRVTDFPLDYIVIERKVTTALGNDCELLPLSVPRERELLLIFLIQNNSHLLNVRGTF
jgi:hypothetical protein